MSHATEALLGQIAELSEQIRDKSGVDANSLNGVLHEFRNALLGFEEAEDSLRRQNQALSEARARMEAERQRYQEMFEFAPDAYLVTNARGVIQEANQAASYLFNTGALCLPGHTLAEFVVEDDRRLLDTLLHNVARIHDIEITLQPQGAPPLVVSLTMSAVFDGQHQPVAMRWMLRDISERRQALAALDASERRFRAIYHGADVGILVLTLEGRIVDSNPAMQSMLGYSAMELNGRPESELSFSQDENPMVVRLNQLVTGGEEHARFEKRFRARNGRALWGQVSLSLLRAGRDPAQYAIAVVRNITVERQTASDLAEIRQRLLESVELERLRLAQELHDGPMQDLYGAIFQISSLVDADYNCDLPSSLDILRGVANTLRDICGDLRPPTLANLGLERAIRSHAEKLNEQHPELNIELQLSPDALELPEGVRLALFRIYQQCMANVLRHSQANRVLVAFQFDQQEIVLDVWDNGRGFHVPEKWVNLLRQGHYGLAGIAERVQALGGTVQVESGLGAGTLVHVVVQRNLHT